MASWFSKLFAKHEDGTQDEGSSFPTGSEYLAMVLDEEESAPAPPRKVIRAPILEEDGINDKSQETIRIKACVLSQSTCRFMVDRPVLPDGYSLVVHGPDEMHRSPLAETIYDLGGIEGVVLHGMNVTVSRSPLDQGDWKPLAIAIGARIRTHIEEGRPGCAEAYFAEMPSAEHVHQQLEKALDEVINPGIAAHSGQIRLDRVEGNTAYIEMLGGCQGCAASQLTLRDGVEQVFREAVPHLGLLLDVTDHDAGTNPFYTSVPSGEQ